ncbi:LLM class flavin-dependent oxidoreductase [Actinopolymorpha pittospori]|uniref:Alkanesulfonate monooxygenase SsuD/methylene tetrahydromethanopterin reductase-like flavin-dependent oxidoreductase (Luciferase family) n=1 Tax=Actinopolymorpha pittospori TaxID=648752 RepID=A0A927MXM1_9ACTN|nr:LLM class flavin-dependent oxidoreductase [Actinopolymorpha pittospori]MBE1605080.1 alkanesulfonate monooxygenase SsuD/methylene tetrahydromethanopterin reductase-like flavin-dependent oxidoreductase (luciferase family) [Actinopolymorpha pittospori]
MPDYGRELSFGYFLVPNAADPLLTTAREVEDLGFDYLGVQDHPYQRRYVDTWTLLSMIAAQTTRLRLFPDVATLALRQPALLAKSAASLDLLSGGRFELGLGAGSFWEAVEGFGGVRRSPGEAYASLAEGIEVIRLLWSGGRNLRYEGHIHRLAGAVSGPVPPHPIGIWLGAYGPRMLGLTGRVADGWVPSLQGGDATWVAEASARVDEAATAAGRPPSDVRRILNVSGTLTSGPSKGLLQGPADQWVDELTDLAVGIGFDTFVLWVSGGDEAAQRREFAERVIPRVRQQVAQERT